MKPNDPKNLTEEEIAKVARIYFESKGWDLYPEVVIPIFNGRPDYIARKQQLCMVVETKRTLTYPVLEQLTRWFDTLDNAEASSYLDVRNYGLPHLLVAVTSRSKGDYPKLKSRILNQFNIGHYEVSYDGEWLRGKDKVEFDPYGYGNIDGHRWRIEERTAPTIQPGSRRTAHKILDHLNEDMKCATAGVTGENAEYMTPFKRTLNKAKQILETYGECHISEIIKIINSDMGGHHYASDTSAKGSISKFLVDFDIADKNDNRPVFRLKGLDDEALASLRKQLPPKPSGKQATLFG